MDARIADLAAQGPEAADALRRARLDRILALSERDRFSEVTGAYEEVQKEGLALPTYVLRVVGDAYMREKNPEAARSVYEAALVGSPGDRLPVGTHFKSFVPSRSFVSAGALGSVRNW